MMVKALRLLFIHLFASLAIWLSTYIAGLDIVLSLVYIWIISLEIINLKKEALIIKWFTAAVWLLIPFILSTMMLFHLYSMAIFLLEFWYTPMLPLLSIKPYLFDSGRPLYYYMLIALPAVFSIHFYWLSKNVNN